MKDSEIVECLSYNATGDINVDLQELVVRLSIAIAVAAPLAGRITDTTLEDARLNLCDRMHGVIRKIIIDQIERTKQQGKWDQAEVLYQTMLKLKLSIITPESKEKH